MPEKEYRVFGLNPDKISALYGAILSIFAVLVSLVSQSKSFTSYIPAMLGLPILVFAVISINYPAKQRLLMHLNVVLGLIIFLGGLSVLGSLTNGTLLTSSFWADLSKLFMSISGALYLIICIRSFIFNRKLKKNLQGD